MVNHLRSAISDALHCRTLRFRPEQSLMEGPSVKYAGSTYFEATPQMPEECNVGA